jgi:hypothetical protein
MTAAITDRELLDLAAKAAQLDFIPSKDGGFGTIGGVLYKPWNPLRDDGDALRLAVKLNIHISLYGADTGMTTWVINGHDPADLAESFDEDYGADPCASARRAIVRAAAAIGRSMP